MKIRCKHCGDFFCPSDESIELISRAYMSPENVNVCDDCWDMFNRQYDETEEMFSDADPGL